MASYEPLNLETDPDAIAQEAFDYIREQIPGYEPRPGHPLTVLIEAEALQLSIERTLAIAAADDAFRRWGALAGIPALEAIAATVPSTWTFVDNAGYTIPAGTQVSIDDGAGGQIGFATTAEVVVPNGNTATGAGEVLLQATETGARTSGLTGAVVPIDTGAPMDKLDSIALTAASSGGQDAETTAVYMDRLAALLRLHSAVAILIDDFAVMPREIAGVARATAIDNYDADTDDDTAEGHVTVAVIDAAGANVSAPTKAAVLFLLTAKRVQNLTVHVIDPDRTAIDVSVTGKCLPGFDPPTVEAAVEAALTEFLSPANWGLPSSGDSEFGAGDWVNRTVLRFQEIVTVVNNVEGFDYYTALTVEGGTADVTLTGGPVTLTEPGTIAATVTAP